MFHVLLILCFIGLVLAVFTSSGDDATYYTTHPDGRMTEQRGKNGKVVETCGPRKQSARWITGSGEAE